MTVKELIEKLLQMPQDLIVITSGDAVYADIVQRVETVFFDRCNPDYVCEHGEKFYYAVEPDAYRNAVYIS